MNWFIKYILNFSYVQKLIYLWFWCLHFIFLSFFIFHSFIFFINLNHDVWYIKSFDIIKKNNPSWSLLNVYVKNLYTLYITVPSRIYSVTNTSVDYALEKGRLVLCLSIVQYVYTFEKLHCFLLFINCLTYCI